MTDTHFTGAIHPSEPIGGDYWPAVVARPRSKGINWVDPTEVGSLVLEHRHRTLVAIVMGLAVDLQEQSGEGRSLRMFGTVQVAWAHTWYPRLSVDRDYRTAKQG